MLENVLRDLGYAIGQKMAQKKQNTLLEQIADQIEAPYQIAQAALPVTPSEQAQQSEITGASQPTEGPLAPSPTPATDLLSPQVGTPGGAQANRYAQIPPGYNQIMNPGTLARILRDFSIPPEMRMKSIGIMGELQNLMSPKRTLTRPFETRSGEYMSMDEHGNVVPLGVKAPEKTNKEPNSLVPMRKGNVKRQVRESLIPQMEAEGWTQDMPIGGEGGGGEGEKIKSPMPMTDKGYMIYFDPKANANIAQKESNGRMIRQIYDPQLHGSKQTEGTPADISQATEAQKRTAKQMVDYKIPLPSGFALRSPYWQGILALAEEIDPTFDATQYNVRLKAKQDFTSGKSAQNIRSINTLIGHLDTLKQKSNALENSSIQLWNKIANTGLTQTGDSRVVEFNNAANAVESELAAVFKGTGATDQEIKQWRQALSASQSPEQLRKGIQTAIELMASRMSALQNQYEVAMGKPKDFRFLSSQSQKILKRLGANVNEIDPGQAGESIPIKGNSQKIGRFNVEVVQ